MADVTQIRLANLRRLIDQLGGPTALAGKLKYTNGSYISQMAGPTPTRAIGEKVARQIEQRLGYESGWLDVDHKGARERGANLSVVSSEPPPEAIERHYRVGEALEKEPFNLPVYGAFKGGFDGAEINYQDRVDTIERPAELRGIPKACGLYITNDSMEPRYYHGEIALVHPGRPVRTGDYVAVELQNGSGMIKRLKRLSADFVELEQHNPPETRRVSRKDIIGLYKIIGTRVGS